MNQNNFFEKYDTLDVHKAIENILVKEISETIDNTILMDIVSPETKGMELSKRFSSYKKRINRKEKLDNLLNEKRQN